MWVTPFSLDLMSALETSHGSITERRGFVVGVGDETKCGGIGEATPLAGWTESREDCSQALAAAVPDTPATHPDPAATPAAAHGLELAQLDRRGCRTATPLATLLRQEAFGDNAASIPTHVPVNATIGDADTDATVTAATRAVASGHNCLKLKLGTRPLDADIDRVRAVRAAVGDEIGIRVDVNGAWTVDTAEQALDELAPLDVAYVEQPLSTPELAAHHELRGQGVDIALDESLATASASAVLAADAADVVILKPMALGGPLQTAQTAAAAHEAGVEPVVTTTIDGVVARTAAVHVAAAIPEIAPCGLATGSLLAADLASAPATVQDGAVSVPSGGGLCGDGFASLRR